MWFGIADRLQKDWFNQPVVEGKGVIETARIISEREQVFLKSLTPGQGALLASAEFYRGVQHDFFACLSLEPELAYRNLKAFEVLGADEYLALLKKVESVFPGGKFPEYAEDMMGALWKQPKNYFTRMADKIVKGKGMRRPLCDYIFDYAIAKPEDFTSPPP